MATYKVIQDIEAEDKLFGPLTLRQFIYGCVSAMFLYLSWLSFSKGAAFMLAIFLPIALVLGFFAWPWGKDQPTEVWALAKIRFLIKPRKRIWNQSGIKELVTITVPKKIERDYTKGLSQTEVRSRLEALASTIDTRGWAIKNVNIYGRQAIAMNTASSDRLLDPSVTMPQEVPALDIRATDDMLDVQSNPVAQQFDTMITAATRAHREQIMQRMRQSTAPEPAAPQPANVQPQNYWFMNQPAQPATAPAGAVTFDTQVVAPSPALAAPAALAPVPTTDEAVLINQLETQSQHQHENYSNMRVLQPLSAQPAMAPIQTSPMQATPVVPLFDTPPPQPQPATQTTVTQDRDAVILNLEGNNDLNVSTLAREAQKRTELPQNEQDEVVISLH